MSLYDLKDFFVSVPQEDLWVALKELEDESAFEARMETLVREIGDRGMPKPQVPEAVPPAATPR